MICRAPMNIGIIESLQLCIDENEIWELMKNEKLHPKHDALFADDPILLPNSYKILSPINLPKNSFGLLARILSYLKFRGALGIINYGSGSYSHMGSFRTIWNDFLQLNLVNDEDGINGINTALLNSWLNDQISKHDSKSIIFKTIRFLEWQSAYNKLPRLLCNDAIRYYQFPDTKDLKELVNEAQPARMESKEKYPPPLMWDILQEAIKYIQDYTKDIMHLMEHKQYLGNPEVNATTRFNRIIYFFRKTEHEFKEPRLRGMQKICKEFVRTRDKVIWKKWYASAQEQYQRWSDEKLGEPNHYGSNTVLVYAVRRWVAANSLILALFNGGRSQEITLQPRNLKTPKTRYHELDKGMNFTRIAWKTERNGKLITTPMPPIGIQAYRNLCRFSELFDGQKTGEIILEDYNKNGERKTQKMYLLLQQFSAWVHGNNALKLTPHELRHAIASIVTHLDKRNGLILAAKLLGHRSATMTMTYEVQLKNFIVEQIQYMADTSEEFKDSMRDYHAKESLKVFNDKIVPSVENGESFYGPAKSFVEFSGDVIKDKKSWFEVMEDALTSGEYGIIDCGTHFCIHSLKSPHQMSCQRGFNLSDYRDAPLIPSVCVGSTCANSFYTEEQAEAIGTVTFKSIKELAPKELQEVAKEWFILQAECLSSPDQKIYEEYMTDQERKNKKNDKESING